MNAIQQSWRRFPTATVYFLICTGYPGYCRAFKKKREIIRDHYTKIVESGSWAYHILNPSITLTRLTKAFGSVSEEEISKPGIEPAYESIWGTISELQIIRKK